MEILNNKNFNSTVGNGLTIVDFYADWCGPCRMLAPNLLESEKKYSDKIKFAKVNIDEYNDLAEKYGVRSIPNLIVFKDGQPINQHIGFMSQEELDKFIESVI